jgi:hypothetical protein
MRWRSLARLCRASAPIARLPCPARAATVPGYPPSAPVSRPFRRLGVAPGMVPVSCGECSFTASREAAQGVSVHLLKILWPSTSRLPLSTKQADCPPGIHSSVHNPVHSTANKTMHIRRLLRGVTRPIADRPGEYGRRDICQGLASCRRDQALTRAGREQRASLNAPGARRLAPGSPGSGRRSPRSRHGK